MAQLRQKLAKGEKLTLRCESLADVVSALRLLYKGAEKTQKDFLETIVGAAIWYLPPCPEHFSGEMSSKALKLCNRDRTQWERLTRDHCNPRKSSGAHLLKGRAAMTRDKMMADYKVKWGRYHLVTREEHRRLTSFHNKGLRETAYEEAGVKLVKAPDRFWNRRRNLRHPLDAAMECVPQVEPSKSGAVLPLQRVWNL